MKRLLSAAGGQDFPLVNGRGVQAPHDRILLLSQWFKAAGGKGLVILFDELERLAHFPYKQRVAAYEQLGWWREAAGRLGSALLPVFTMSAGFLQGTVTGGDSDAQRLNIGALRTSPEIHDQRMWSGVDLLKTQIPLERVTSEQELAIIRRVRDLYLQAYGVVPDDEIAPYGDDQIRIRTRVRKQIARWDLWRYDPAYKAEFEADPIDFDEHEIDDNLATEDDSDE